eukprot:2129115-Rhodomonas_salina.1
MKAKVIDKSSKVMTLATVINDFCAKVIKLAPMMSAKVANLESGEALSQVVDGDVGRRRCEDLDERRKKSEGGGGGRR